jgi:hypothetical protein
MDARKTLLEKRDVKARPHLEQYAPVWLVDEKLLSESDTVQFNVVFQHHLYGWVNRRYRFDGFNNVLYYLGQTTLSEEEVVEKIQQQEPYVAAIVADMPNAYGG